MLFAMEEALEFPNVRQQRLYDDPSYPEWSGIPVGSRKSAIARAVTKV